MSTYSIKCNECGHRFEHWIRGLKDDDYIPPKCPKCGKDTSVVPSIIAKNDRNWANWRTGRDD